MSTKTILIAALCGTVTLAFVVPAATQDLSSGRWIDLTHSFNADSVYRPTAEKFEKDTVFAGETDR